MFFVNATNSQKGKVILNPRASIAQTTQQNAGIKMQALKRVQFCANNLGEGVGPVGRVSVTGRVVSNFCNFYFFCKSECNTL